MSTIKSPLGKGQLVDDGFGNLSLDKVDLNELVGNKGSINVEDYLKNIRIGPLKDGTGNVTVKFLQSITQLVSAGTNGQDGQQPGSVTNARYVSYMAGDVEDIPSNVATAWIAAGICEEWSGLAAQNINATILGITNVNDQSLVASYDSTNNAIKVNVVAGGSTGGSGGGNVVVTNTPAVTISGTPAVTVSNSVLHIDDNSGSLTVDGTVAISGTPNVSISNTPAVTISGTPTVTDTVLTDAHDSANHAVKVNLVSGGVTSVAINNTPAVTISGTPTVTVGNSVLHIDDNSGSLTVDGSVSITGTPAVTVSGTPNVNISNSSIPVTGTVAVSGTPTVADTTLTDAHDVANHAVKVNLVSGGITSVSVSNTPAVTISGTPSVTVGNSVLHIDDNSGSLTVDGSVSITGTPNVSISNTPAVTVSGTPAVADTHLASAYDSTNTAIKVNMVAGGSSSVSISNQPTVTVGNSVLHIDDNSGSLTVDGTVAISGTPNVSISNTPAVADTTLTDAHDAANHAVKVSIVSGEASSVTISNTPTVTVGNSSIPITDNAGSLTVDDGGSSLTVDGTVAISGTPTVTVGNSSIPVTDNGGSLTIDDGGSAITVDGTVAISGTPTVNIGTMPVVSILDNGTSLTVDDGGNSLTVDGTVTESNLSDAHSASTNGIRASGRSIGGYYPEPGTISQTVSGLDDLGLMFDSSNNIVTRSTVTTDEGSLRESFQGTSLYRNFTGNVTFTNGSAEITTVGNFLDGSIQFGDYVRLSTDTDSNLAQVNSVNSATSITLSANYTGTGGTGTCYLTKLNPVIGTGGSITVGSSQCTIALGTTASARTAVTRSVDYGPLTFTTSAAISQRIPNQTIYIGMSDDPIQPGNMAWFKFDTTTGTTQVACEASFSLSGMASSLDKESIVVTLPNGDTTATAHRYRIELTQETATYYINEVVVCTLRQNIPSPYAYMDIFVGGTNNSSVPVSNTNIILDYIYITNTDAFMITGNIMLGDTYDQTTHAIRTTPATNAYPQLQDMTVALKEMLNTIRYPPNYNPVVNSIQVSQPTAGNLNVTIGSGTVTTVSTVTTCSTCTTCSTVTTLSNIDGYQGKCLLLGQSYAAWAATVRSRIN